METETSVFLSGFCNYYSVLSGDEDILGSTLPCVANTVNNSWYGATEADRSRLDQDCYVDFPDILPSAEEKLEIITIQGLDLGDTVIPINEDKSVESMSSPILITDPGSLVMDLDNLTDSCPFEWDLNLENLITTRSELPDLSPIGNDICGEFFDHNSGIIPDQQPKVASSNEDPTKPIFQCTYGQCRKVYAKAAHLRSHIRRHLGHKPYICTWKDCSWRFNRSDELARHRRSHSGDKNYTCDYCPKKFTRSDHLSKHRKVHERKIASGKVKGVWRVLPKAKPGRKPKKQAKSE